MVVDQNYVPKIATVEMVSPVIPRIDPVKTPNDFPKGAVDQPHISSR